MIKYHNTLVVFDEVPDEITLAINITNCPCHCKGCHSPFLAEDTGEELTISVLQKLIEENEGISCIAFMGGDNDPEGIGRLAEWVKRNTSLKTCWYSGKQYSLYRFLKYLDYYKSGPYMKEYGPLNCRTTNQRFYKVSVKPDGSIDLTNITNRFWKYENSSM